MTVFDWLVVLYVPGLYVVGALCAMAEGGGDYDDD